jgi:hypothetical protein
VSKQTSLVDKPGIEAMTAAKIEECVTELAIEPDWSTHNST